MEGYSYFAGFYDFLTGNVDYPGLADYLLSMMERLGHRPGITLDLACGTGSLTLELFRRGVDVYGADASIEMLSKAREKCADAGADILFLCQRMQSLNLYGTVNTVVCTLDSLNHLHGAREVKKAFSRVSLFLEPGGYFLFDMNTPYKHREVLGENVFVYEPEGLYCVWQNHFVPASCRADIILDFFQREGKNYTRSREAFSEWAYPQEEVEHLLSEAGFGKIEVFHERSFSPPRQDSQRLFYAAKKL